MADTRDPYVFSEPPVFDGGTPRDRDELGECPDAYRKNVRGLIQFGIHVFWNISVDA
jgi:hypothetical protein